MTPDQANTPLPLPPEKIFLPWNQVVWQDPTPYILILAIFIVIMMLLLRLRTYQKKAEAARALEAKLQHIIQIRLLTEEEASHLTTAVHHCNASSPSLALTSRHYFDSFLAPQIAAHAGEGTCELIRTKLFGDTKDEFSSRHPHFSNTHNIPEGMLVTVHIGGFPGRFPARIEINTPQQIEAILSPTIPPEALQVNDTIEGFFEAENALIGFQSHIVSLTPSSHGLHCSIAHTDHMGELHHRESLRIPRNDKIIFTFSAHPRKSTAPKTPPRNAIGTLQDISLGGCAITTNEEHPMHPGDRISCELTLAKNMRPILLHGDIRVVERLSSSSFRLHISFTCMNARLQNRLSSLIYTAG